MDLDTTAELYLVGFRIEPDIYDPQLYTIYVNDQHPILSNRQPILFTHPNLAPTALMSSDCSGLSNTTAPSELYTVYDIVDAVYTLNRREREQANELLNLLNIILDCYNCMMVRIPEGYQKSLEVLADHLTFNEGFSEFIANNGLSKERITDIIYWSLGMIIYNSKIIVANKE